MSGFAKLANGPILFTAATPSVSPRGTVSEGFDPTGVSVAGYVSSKQVRDVQPDGLVVSETVWMVWLFADPSTLNGGLGVRQDDAFLWRSIRLVAQSAPRPMQCGKVALWRVDCLSKT